LDNSIILLSPCARRGLIVMATLGAISVSAAQSARSDELVEPPTLSSINGMLDILMVATPKPVPTISFAPPGGGASINPTGWVYEVCPRPPSANRCPIGQSTFSNYGGVRRSNVATF
jgi:L-ascorbate oxidase